MEDPRETLFPGPALDPPEQAGGSGWVVRFGPDEPPWAPPVEVRHARGYGAFASQAAARGGDPAALAGDLAALLAFVCAHPALLDEAASATAAGTFFGNALIVSHPAAAWQPGAEREVGTDTRRIPVDGVLRHLVEGPARVPDLLAMLAGWDEADAQHALVRQAMDEATDDARAPALVHPSRPFVRPAVPGTTSLDGAGAPVPCGERWTDSPPDDAYGRVTHPQRFAPVHVVADALVRYLAEEYAVEVQEERDAGGERVVRLVPEQGAPVTVRFRSFPDVEVRAGAFFRVVASGCGCDACDETAAAAAEQLAGPLLAVAAGGLTERWPIGPGGEHVVGLRTPDGASGSSGATDADSSPEARAALAALPDGRWPAWPLRVREETVAPAP